MSSDIKYSPITPNGSKEQGTKEPPPDKNTTKSPILKWGLISISLLGIIAILFTQGEKMASKVEIHVTIHHNNDDANTNSMMRGSNNNINNENSILDTNEEAEEINIDTSIPKCAKNIYVTLHKEIADDTDEHSCKGMLLRDDLLLTTNDCSKYTFTFDFKGAGEQLAIPHPTLNAKMIDSELGFLQVNPPYHYQWIDAPTRRTRMFVSLQSTIVDDEENNTKKKVILSCTTDNKPIAHNFVSLDDDTMIPLTELHDVLLNNNEVILWEHLDLYTSTTLGNDHGLWWSKSVRLDDEEKYMKSVLQDYVGPIGTVSLPMAHYGSYVKQVAAVLEAVDPRGHRKECFLNYYKRWQEENPFSGAKFFDWLDYGNGKGILDRNMELLKAGGDILFEPMEDDRKCRDEAFNTHKVHYFDQPQRDFHEVYITPSDDNTELIWRYKNNDERIPESDMNNPHLYMWDMNKTFYIVDSRWKEKKYGPIKHTSVLDGVPALSGGKAYFGKNGASELLK